MPEIMKTHDHLMSRDPAWERQSIWTPSTIPTKLIINDSTSRPPGFNLPCRLWTTSSCIWTNHGRHNYLVHKCKIKDSLSCNIQHENIQSITHIIIQCPKHGFKSEMDDTRHTTKEALKWLIDLQLHLLKVILQMPNTHKRLFLNHLISEYFHVKITLIILYGLHWIFIKATAL